MITSTTRFLWRFSSSDATSWLRVLASTEPRVPRRRVWDVDSLMLRNSLGGQRRRGRRRHGGRRRRAERRAALVADVADRAGQVVPALVTVRAVGRDRQIDNSLSAEK